MIGENSLLNKVYKKTMYCIALGFGSGLIPFAPGTWGTLVAIPIYLFLITVPSLVFYGFFVLTAFLLGLWVCDTVSKELGIDDPSVIVWDEIVGYLLTMTAVPKGWFWVVAGFFLFRLFDIWKPGPIRWIDKKIKGGLGIMLDDALAAIPAWMILQVLWRVVR